MSLLLFTSTALAAEAKLVTVGPGKALFARFGHAALCIEVPEKGNCYNYGTARFTPGLVLGFLRGTAPFWVSVVDRDEMLDHYRHQGRDVWVQTLPLSDDQVRALELRLHEGAKKENRRYTYDPIGDNCSTRLRDHVDWATNGALQPSKNVAWHQTYRQALRRGLSAPWMALTELGVTSAADQIPHRWDAMVDPSVLRQDVREHLGAAPQHVLNGTGNRTPRPWSGRGLLGAMGLVGAVTIRWWPKGPAILLTTLGVLVWLVSLLSVEPLLMHNPAMMALMPTDALLLRRRALPYVVVRLVALGLLVLFQPMWASLLAALLLLGTLAQRLTSPD